MSDDDDELPLSRAQFRAAQMMVARMLAEAEGTDFDFDAIGIDWIADEDIICAVSEEGEQISVGDLLYATIVLLWSTLIDSADATGEPLVDAIGRLGLGVALNEP